LEKHGMNRPPSAGPIAACRRCGTCCEKDGPTLHERDRPLVESGAIPLRLLVTLRKGEFVSEPESNRFLRTEEEMIKLKGVGSGWTCICFEAGPNRCTIYDRRPVQCRAMTCWDTAEIRKVMATPKLRRHDLLAGVEGLWELIEEHERRCGLLRLHELSTAFRGKDKEAAENDLMEMLCYDRALREVLVENGAAAEHLEFLLGRPLDRLLHGFGLRLRHEKGRPGIARL
jgi:Fe-S-cluster containining protein